MVLIDCGYSGFLQNIEEAMGEKGLDCNKLTKIIITHQDHDHLGALAQFQKKYPTIKVIASEVEAHYITGERKSLRLEQAEEMQKFLPEEQKEFGRRFIGILKNVEPAHVDITVKEGNTFPWCGGCEIIETPGHTPGHISLYLINKKIMITGDAAVIENNNLVIANPQFTLDIKKAEESLLKLKEYDVDTFICYHGGVYKPD